MDSVENTLGHNFHVVLLSIVKDLTKYTVENTIQWIKYSNLDIFSCF